MYLEHFGMRELPFTLTPNTDFFIDLDGHHRALEVIRVALEGGEGFIKITGEVGTGKTLLCRRLLNTLDERFVSAYIPNPYLTPDGLMLALAEELGVEVERGKGRHHALNQINRRLMAIRREGRQVVFLLDEAQAMPEESIEALRLLTNLETETDKLLQVVLFGQPELDEMLSRDSLRQLRQRITFSYQLPVLNREEVHSYLNHRLGRSGFSGANLFTTRAARLLADASRGIPRLINILAHKSLLVAYGRGDGRIAEIHVKRAIEDTEDLRSNRQPERQHAGTGKLWLMIVVTALLSSAFTLAMFSFIQ